MPAPTPLKRAIFESGTTQRAVALHVGIREDHFSRIVNGLRADPEVQARIAAALGRPVAELFPVHDAVIGGAGDTTEAA